MLLSVAFVALTLSGQPEQPKPFELKDGDRIVWIGGTLVEREQRYGYWETALLAANPGKKITFRNLGWSGDTVWGESRGRFDFANADKCFHQLVDLTLELKPTVIFISYGTNESFAGKDGLARFEKGLETLLDALKPAGARIVLFTPIPFEAGPRFPDPKARNAALRMYADAVRKVAAERKSFCADLFATVGRRMNEYDTLRQHKAIRDDEALTGNGMHLSGTGYSATTVSFLQSLGLVGEIPSCPVGFELPAVLKELNKNLEPLRQAVIAKNELFFYRWRPQNETYLFGFRKHEQGKNAKEVAEFDPLVSKAEEEIERMRKTIK
ncbi:MAG TPA: SGNH/GDSL hydrolase family protein [Gemmata sp.]|nr:SGNH/GDSL hydrolase family protein [Gemmata sp.]